MKTPANIYLVALTLCLHLGVQAPTAAAQAESERSSESTEADDEPAWRSLLRGFYARVGLLVIAPLGQSSEVELSNVGGPARLAIDNGPIAGSFVELGNKAMPAVIVGYQLPILNRQLSIETILALPFSLKMKAGGTLANQSLAPTALDNLPTGIAPLGSELGEVKVLPPVVTATYRFFPELPVHPYIGAGVSLMLPLSARITSRTLTEVTQPEVHIDSRFGYVLQAGIDLQLYKSLYVLADFKYIGGLDLEARVTNIWVRTPQLPLYEAVKVGDNVVKLTANPIVLMLAIGVNL